MLIKLTIGFLKSPFCYNAHHNETKLHSSTISSEPLASVSLVLKMMLQPFECPLPVNFINIKRANLHTKVLFGSFFYLHVTAKKVICTKKRVCKTLVKLTPGVNFANILLAAFTLVGPKSAK